ncbi:MAG: GntR family transcriptional regulator [Blastocatellia bacterium]
MTAKLYKNSPAPLYFQIEQALREAIEAGALGPGHALSERDLSERYGVSRMTVRQALRALREEGLLFSERGRGTFVSAPRLNVQTRQLLGFSEDMRARGLEPASRVLHFTRGRPPDNITRQLQLAGDGLAFEIVRLRLAGGIPMARESCFVDARLCPQLQRADVENGSLYRYLEDSCGVRIQRAEEILEAACATREEAEALSIKPRAAVLVVQRTVYTTDNTPLEVVRSVYRGDRYQAIIQLRRNGQPGRNGR